MRTAIAQERKLRMRYVDGAGKQTDRIVWPFAWGYFARSRILAAWCEVRQDFRHFQTDRIRTVQMLDARYPERRGRLLKRWRAAGADRRWMPDSR